MHDREKRTGAYLHSQAIAPAAAQLARPGAGFLRRGQLAAVAI